jgi:hypothetical protein
MADPVTGPLTATFRKPFAEQVAAWRLRLGELRPTASSADPGYTDFARAFMVAGAVKADLLADLAAAVDRAIVEGTGYAAFKRDFQAIVEKHGWHSYTGSETEKGREWRMRTIYRTNMRTTYMAGRHAQLVDGNYRFWVYRHSGAAHPRLDHLSWDGVALPPDHPFWRTHYPPNGWGCGCLAEGARTEKGIRRAGGNPDKKLPEGWDRRDPKTGAPPGIGKGWAKSPEPDAAGVIVSLKDKLPGLPAPIGAAMAAIWPETARRRLEVEFEEFVRTALKSRSEGSFIVAGALKPAWVDAARSRGVEIESAEIVVTDRDVHHTFRGTGHITASSTRMPAGQAPKVDPLDLDWYVRLPSHLLSPQAVLLDTLQKKPVFLLIYDVPGRKAKLVVELNAYLKKGPRDMNKVTSGRMVTRNDLLASLGRGVEVLEGEV